MIRRHVLLFLLAFSLLVPATHTAYAASVPAISTDTSLIRNGSIVYFGKIGSEYAPWTVLSDGNDARLATSGKGKALLYANLVPKQYEHFSQTTNKYSSAWEDSYAKEYCETFFTDWDSPVEQAAIASTHVTETTSVTLTASNTTFLPVSLTGEHVFLLSAYEATKYFDDDADRILVDFKGMKQQYWFRSPTKNGAWVAINHSDTGRLDIKDPSNYSGMRMALNLDLSRVFAISSASAGKPSGTDGVLMPLGTNSTDKWKLTLRDEARQFSAAASAGAILRRPVGYRGWMVDVAYTGAVSGENECISAILCDSSGKALNYGSVHAQAEGTATFIMPQGLKKGTYTLKVCSEQKNTDLQSDYSSDYQSIKLTVGDGGSADEPGFMLPTNIKRVAPGAFEGIAAGIVVIPDGCESIGTRAFAGCRNLVQVYIPSSVMNVDDIAPDAFADCGHIYMVGVSGGAAQAYCDLSEHANFTFVPVGE